MWSLYVFYFYTSWSILAKHRELSFFFNLGWKYESLLFQAISFAWLMLNYYFQVWLPIFTFYPHRDAISLEILHPLRCRYSTTATEFACIEFTGFKLNFATSTTNMGWEDTLVLQSDMPFPGWVRVAGSSFASFFFLSTPSWRLQHQRCSR
jgi:hypothetical protein